MTLFSNSAATTLTRRACVVSLLALGAAVAAPAFANPASSPVTVNLTVRDHARKFYDFYAEAVQAKAEGEKRWALWKEYYDFVPAYYPDEAAAKAAIERSWGEYDKNRERLRKGFEGLDPSPGKLFEQTLSLYKSKQPVTARLTSFVGAFEGKPYSLFADGVYDLYVPVEVADVAPAMAREVGRIAHRAEAGYGGRELTLAETIFHEGIAARAAKALVTGATPEEYLGTKDGWLAAAEAKQGAIFDAVRNAIRDTNPATAKKFLSASGPNGIDREAAYVGWVVVGHYLKSFTLADLAHVPSKDLPKIISEAMDKVELARVIATKKKK